MTMLLVTSAIAIFLLSYALLRGIAVYGGYKPDAFYQAVFAAMITASGVITMCVFYTLGWLNSIMAIIALIAIIKIAAEFICCDKASIDA